MSLTDLTRSKVVTQKEINRDVDRLFVFHPWVITVWQFWNRTIRRLYHSALWIPHKDHYNYDHMRRCSYCRDGYTRWKKAKYNPDWTPKKKP